MPILPKHFYAAYLKEPQKFNESKGLLLGSGPYKLIDPKNWTPDKGNVELVRNERYWGDVQPSYNRVMWKIIQNDSARLTTYRNGDIDTYSARPVEYQELKKDAQIIAKSQSFEIHAASSRLQLYRLEPGASRQADALCRQAGQASDDLSD